MPKLVLNQYRAGSSYKDKIGSVYHFPKKYLNAIDSGIAEFIYYEPRNGGDQVYFGCGRLGQKAPDAENEAYYYCEIFGYTEFPKPVPYRLSLKATREKHSFMRNSVRLISDETFREILRSAGLVPSDEITPDAPSDLENAYATARAELKRFLAARYERPNSVTNFVKKTRGSKCQICGYQGFKLKKSGRYCEVHHLFHLAKQLPGTLSPKYLIVVCANCHRKLHYGDCSDPVRTVAGWSVTIEGMPVIIPVVD